jgi:sugar-specific transcriptional regulator TrmB
MRNIIPLLKKIGLLESESKTYLAALELGPSTVIEINKKIGLSRQAIYTAINNLIERGLMSSVEKEGRTYFNAESPDRLLSFAEAELKSLENSVKEMKQMGDDLKLLQKGEKPVVKMYEGLEGLKAIYDDLITTKPKTLEEFGNEDAVESILNDEILSPLKEKLSKLGTTGRFLSTTPSGQASDARKGTQHIRFNDGSDFKGDILTYGNKVALSSFRGKMLSVIIESPDIADTIRALFNLAWKCQKNK